MTDTELFERLAGIEHQRWADWQRYVFATSTINADGTATIPAWAVQQWQRQIETAYHDLSPREQESDRAQVHRYWVLLCEWRKQ